MSSSEELLVHLGAPSCFWCGVLNPGFQQLIVKLNEGQYRYRCGYKDDSLVDAVLAHHAAKLTKNIQTQWYPVCKPCTAKYHWFSSKEK